MGFRRFVLFVLLLNIWIHPVSSAWDYDCDDWGSLYSLGGYNLYDFGLDIFNIGSSYESYDSWGCGFDSCYSPYDTVGFYGYSNPYDTVGFYGNSNSDYSLPWTETSLTQYVPIVIQQPQIQQPQITPSIIPPPPTSNPPWGWCDGILVPCNSGPSIPVEMPIVREQIPREPSLPFSPAPNPPASNPFRNPMPPPIHPPTFFPPANNPVTHTGPVLDPTNGVVGTPPIRNRIPREGE